MTFNTTHQAIAINELLQNYDEYHTNIISTPGKISAGCGMSVRFDYTKKASILKLLSDKDLNYQDIYLGTRKGVRSTYTLDN